MTRDDIKEIARGHCGIIEMIGNFLPKINETGALDTQCGSLEDFGCPACRGHSVLPDNRSTRRVWFGGDRPDEISRQAASSVVAGMGVVYKAPELRLDRPISLELLSAKY